MKKIFLIVVLLHCLINYAQKNCDYSANENDSLGTYKATNDYIIHERTFGNTQATVFFSLINADGLPSLKVQLIQKSDAFVSAKCFDKNSKVFLQLNNGKIISFVAIDNEVCGETIRNESFNNRVLSGYFLFTKDSFEALQSSPISIMRIKYTTETVDYVLKEELVSEIDTKTYFPSTYFVNYLKCIID